MEIRRAERRHRYQLSLEASVCFSALNGQAPQLAICPKFLWDLAQRTPALSVYEVVLGEVSPLVLGSIATAY